MVVVHLCSPYCPRCPATRVTAGTPQHRGTTKDPGTKTSPRKAAVLVGASGVLAEVQASMKADTAAGTVVKNGWKEKKTLKEGKKEQRRTVCGTQKRTLRNRRV